MLLTLQTFINKFDSKFQSHIWHTLINHLFAKKPLIVLLEELRGDNRLIRIPDPITLTSLGVGAIIGTGIFVFILTGLLPSRMLVELVNIEILFAIVVVCSAVLIIGKTHSNADCQFKSPWFPFIPLAGIINCLLLTFSLPEVN